jgi:cyclopropane-fatty-acyl-phospholipid synthase
MSSATITSADPAASVTVRLLERLSQDHSGNFTVRLWTGATWQPWSGPSGFTLVLKHPGALRAMFWPFDRVGLGEAYIFDDFDIEGDMFAFTGWLRHILLLADGRGLVDKLRLLWALKKLPNQKNPRDLSKAGRPTEGDHSRPRDREAISYSYDLPGEFYRLFLDPNTGWRRWGSPCPVNRRSGRSGRSPRPGWKEECESSSAITATSTTRPGSTRRPALGWPSTSG